MSERIEPSRDNQGELRVLKYRFVVPRAFEKDLNTVLAPGLRSRVEEWVFWVSNQAIISTKDHEDPGFEAAFNNLEATALQRKPPVALRPEMHLGYIAAREFGGDNLVRIAFAPHDQPHFNQLVAPLEELPARNNRLPDRSPYFFANVPERYINQDGMALQLARKAINGHLRAGLETHVLLFDGFEDQPFVANEPRNLLQLTNSRDEGLSAMPERDIIPS